MNPIISIPLLVVIVFFISWKTKKKQVKNNLPPSPSKLPIIGNLHQLGPLLYRSLQKLSAKHGSLMLLQLGRVATLIISSPTIAQEILKTHDLIFANRPEIKASRIIFYGTKDLAFAPYGEYWRQIRKICATRLFSSRMVQSFKPVREEETAYMIENIKRSENENGIVPLTEILSSFTTDLICRVVLGKSMKRDKERRKLVSELIHANAVLFGALCVEDFFPAFWWLDVLLGLEGKLKGVFKRWDALLEEALEEHVAWLDTEGEDRIVGVNFAYVLLSLQNNFPGDFCLERNHIKAVLMDMITAGSETTSGVLDWCMAELIRNPLVLNKVQSEVRTNCHATSWLIKEDNLTNLIYLKAVIKETLRLHPPAPLLLPRKSLQECEIQGYIIPKHTRVLVNAWAIGRDAEAWEAAEEFKPERFLYSNVDYKGQDFHFIPFGAGRRICPGMQFATAAIELVLANLLYFFDWKLPVGMEKEDVDMGEAPGLSAPRKQKLELVAIPRHDFL